MSKRFFAALAVMLFGLSSSAFAAQSGWKFGIGTGPAAVAIDGTGGLNTVLGPVEVDFELSSDEVRDYTASAFGLGGFASKGRWRILWAVGQLELAEDLSGMTAAGPPVALEMDANFIVTLAEVTPVYLFSVGEKNQWGALFGPRYTKNELDGTLVVGANPPIKRNIDESWTDLLLGLTHDRVLSPKWSWNNRVDTGVGQSESYFNATTGVSWAFAKRWMARFNARYTTYDLETDDKGDPGWYLNDSDETAVGVNVLVVWP